MTSRYNIVDILASECFYGDGYNSPGGDKIYKHLDIRIDHNSMIELGSGLGGTAKYFNTNEYIGIDNSKDMVDLSSKRHGKKFICGDFLQLPLPACDVFFTREVFMYLSAEDAKKYAKKIAELSRECIYFDLIKGVPSDEFDRYEKKRGWSTHTLSQVLECFDMFDYEHTDISEKYAEYLSSCLSSHGTSEVSKRAFDKLKFIRDGSLRWCFIKFTAKK